jgi:hypothetical protein
MTGMTKLLADVMKDSSAACASFSVKGRSTTSKRNLGLGEQHHGGQAGRWVGPDEIAVAGGAAGDLQINQPLVQVILGHNLAVDGQPCVGVMRIWHLEFR